jgi:SAM-dependent methyltransferase
MQNAFLYYQGAVLQPLFDHGLLHRRLQRPAFKQAGNPFLEAIVGDLPLRLSPIKRDFGTALSLFPPDSRIDDALQHSTKIGALQILRFDEIRNFEALPFNEGSFDLIFSCLGLQYANDLPGVLAQLQRTLKPGGLLMGCLMGGDTLAELRTAFAQAETEISGGVTPRIHPSIDIRQMGSLLQRAKLVEPIIDIEKFDLTYANLMALLKDLRAWSAGNLLIERARTFMSHALSERVSEIYKKKFSATNGKITAHFDLIWFSGWRESKT